MVSKTSTGLLAASIGSGARCRGRGRGLLALLKRPQVGFPRFAYTCSRSADRVSYLSVNDSAKHFVVRRLWTRPIRAQRSPIKQLTSLLSCCDAWHKQVSTIRDGGTTHCTDGGSSGGRSATKAVVLHAKTDEERQASYAAADKEL